MKTNSSYLFIRLLTFPIGLLPIRVIHQLGKGLGILAYYTLKKYRKRTLSNLALAKDLHFDEKELTSVGKRSFQNLAITCLEYAKFSVMKNTKRVLICENPEKAKKLIDAKQGVIFFCGHQANWEVLFLEGTTRMPGVAVGRPIKNSALYEWVVQMRERFGGTIIRPKQTLKEGLRALKQGKFFGIVGDQGVPESNYSFPFLGRRAWTSVAPALLSYRSKSPIIVATVKRVNHTYRIHYSDPIWPDLKRSMEEEIPCLMAKCLKLLEAKICETPDQWLWQHNRWKQDPPFNIYYRFRWDTLLIILPEDPTPFLSHLSTFRTIYPQAFITICYPASFKKTLPLDFVDHLTYKTKEDLFLRDYRFKLVFNFSGLSMLKKHFLKLSAFEVLDEKALKEAAKEHLTGKEDLSLLLLKALTRPNTLWKKDAS